MASTAQLAANRANAKLSTGPRTEKGKARSARNASVLVSAWRLRQAVHDDKVRLSQYDMAARLA